MIIKITGAEDDRELQEMMFELQNATRNRHMMMTDIMQAMKGAKESIEFQKRVLEVLKLNKELVKEELSGIRQAMHEIGRMRHALKFKEEEE